VKTRYELALAVWASSEWTARTRQIPRLGYFKRVAKAVSPGAITTVTFRQLA
jgi:hypothetical protein